MNSTAFLFIGMDLFGLASLAKKKEKSLFKNVSTVVFVAVMSAWAAYIPPDWNPFTYGMVSLVFTAAVCGALYFFYYKKGGNNKKLLRISLLLSVLCVVFFGGPLLELLSTLFVLVRYAI